MVRSRFDIKVPLRPAVRAAREAAALVRLGWEASGQGRRRSAVFLPAYGPEGAALLRIYNVARALRAQGWRTHILPPAFTLSQRLRWLRVLRPDVVIMQGTRHALNRPALYPDYRIFLDLDDADFHLPHLAPSLAGAMGHVAAVIAGSEYIADWCRRAGAPATHVVWTGTPVSIRPRAPQPDRPPIVAWAQTRPMDYVGEAGLVRTVMRQVAARHPGITLRLYDRRSDDDPGFADSFRASGLTVEWRPKVQFRDYCSLFDDVALGLAPLSADNPFSLGKSFGKILTYLDRGVPVIASAVGEPGLFFTPATGRVCRTPGEWADSIVDLLDDAPARTRIAAAGSAALEQRLSIEAAAAGMAAVLSSTRLAGTGPLAKPPSAAAAI